MNFTVVSLLSLLSFTSLVSSPALCMHDDSEEESTSSPLSPRSPRLSNPRLPAELNLDSLVADYDFVRSQGNRAPDEGLIGYLAKGSWDAMNSAQKEKVIAYVKENSTYVPAKSSIETIEAGQETEEGGSLPVTTSVMEEEETSETEEIPTPANPSRETIEVEEETKKDGLPATTSVMEEEETTETEGISTYSKKLSVLFTDDERPVSFTWEDLSAKIPEEKEESHGNRTREQVLKSYLTEYYGFTGGKTPYQKYTLPYDSTNSDLSICQKDLDGAIWEKGTSKLQKQTEIALGQNITTGSTKNVLDKMTEALGLEGAPTFKTSREGLKKIKGLVSSFLSKIDKQIGVLKVVVEDGESLLDMKTTFEWEPLDSPTLFDLVQRLSKIFPSLTKELKEEREEKKNKLLEAVRKLKEATEAAKKKEEELNANFATKLAEVKRAHEAHLTEEAKKLTASEETIKIQTTQLDIETKKTSSLATELETEKFAKYQLSALLKKTEKELEGKADENKRFKEAIDGIQKSLAGLVGLKTDPTAP